MLHEDRHISEQIAYYRARAPEYDEWLFRKGRYDRGEDHRKRWFSELECVREALVKSQPGGYILELACGTGFWTSQLIEYADAITALDASPEMIEINRLKNGDERIDYRIADIFNWQADKTFDYIFFGFWLSHVPADRFEGFWNTIKASLKPGGTVFFIDSLQTQESTARNHGKLTDSGKAERKLNDGREFTIVKVFYNPGDLERQISDFGFEGRVRTTGEFFLFGSFRKSHT